MTQLYEDYVERLTDSLTSASALMRRDVVEAVGPPPMPPVDVPESAAPMLLADGQLLVLLPDAAAAARASNSKGSAQLVAVAEQRVVNVVNGEEAPLAYDNCSQQVLPWRPQAEAGWEAALRRDAQALPGPAADALAGLAKAKQGLSTTEAPLLRAALGALVAQADTMLSVAEQLSVIAALASKVRVSHQAIREAASSFQVELPAQVAEWWTPERKEEEEAIYKLRTRKGPDGSIVAVPEHQLTQAEKDEIQRLKHGLEPGVKLKLEMQQMQSRIRASVEQLEVLLAPAALEALAVDTLRSSGAVGVRRYAAGQPLTVRLNGVWRDAEVEGVASDGPQGGAHAAHRVQPEGASTSVLLRPHPWNHAPRELPAASVEALRSWWAASMRQLHAHINDTLTGQQLDTLQQLTAIDVAAGDGATAANNAATSSMRREVSDARSLSAWLSKQYLARLDGGAVDEPCAALLTAGPAAGKTTVTSQVVLLTLGFELVPILVKVQRLQHRLKEAPAAFAAAPNYIDAFLSLEQPPAVHSFLRQLMAARRALIILDGLDEAGGRRAEIEVHVAEVLAPQGHVLLCTSRPAGVDEERFAHFRRLHLRPFSEAQQREALEQRLGGASGATLLEYVRERMPRDETGALVTSNPLMLSMLASVYELRQGINMPRTVAGLYATASGLMLDRDGGRGASAAVQRLLQAVFFAAHVAQRREIEDWQLDEAALALDAPKLLATLHSAAGCSPFEPFEEAAELGHYVEAVNIGMSPTAYSGQRGTITEVANGRCKVALADGTVCLLKPSQLKSSGLTEAVFRAQAMAARADELRAGCIAQLSEPAREALAEIRRRVAADSLPLLSLLQAEPLRLQSSHLSFQDYFAALALCEEGTRLSGAPPWQWTAWWANAVRLGTEMGDTFGRGLRRAAGMAAGDKLDLNHKLGGDRPTALRALAAMKFSSLSLRANGLGADEVEAVAEMVRTSESLTFLDLRYNALGSEGCRALAEALNARPGKALPLSMDMEYQQGM